MHSSLRDRLERRSFWLNTLLIAASLFLCVFAFIGDDLLRSVRLDPASTRFVLGFVSVALLILSIIEFRVNLSSVAGKHQEAIARLAALKSKYRKSFTETGGADPAKNARLTKEYDKVMSNLPAIPERWFNTLKAEHVFKRLLSQRVSQFPKAPRWFLRLQLRFEGMREAWRLMRSSHKEEQQDGSRQA
jgi:hypothetical protein